VGENTNVLNLITQQKLLFLKAFTLGDFPAPMSLGAVTSLLSAFMTATVQVLEKHRLKTGQLLVRSGNLIGYFILVIPFSHHFIAMVCKCFSLLIEFYLDDSH